MRGAESVKSQTLPTSAGMFMELVAKPIPKVMTDSTPRKLATSRSSSSWMPRFPAIITDGEPHIFPFVAIQSQVLTEINSELQAHSENMWTAGENMILS